MFAESESIADRTWNYGTHMIKMYSPDESLAYGGAGIILDIFHPDSPPPPMFRPVSFS
jgi:hypothetical protein